MIAAAKSEMPEGTPLIMRISAKEYTDGGYDLPEAWNLVERTRKQGGYVPCQLRG